MEQRQRIMLIGSIAVISICVIAMIYFLFFSGEPPTPNRRPQVDKVYFYNLKTKALFAADTTEIPPIMAPGQAAGKPQGVRAYVLSCGDCSEQWIGWLERYKPAAKTLKVSPPPNGLNAKQAEILHKGGEIRPADGTDKDWVWAKSEEALQIRNKALEGKCPDGKKPRDCYPKE